MPGFFGELNLIVLVLIFLLFFYNLKTAFLACLIFGFILDIFSFHFFGLNILSLFLALALSAKVSISWLTNRSLYSFLLINILAIFVYKALGGLFFYLSDFSFSAFIFFRGDFWLGVLYQMIWAILISVISFNLMLSFNNKLKPDFLGGKFFSKD